MLSIIKISEKFTNYDVGIGSKKCFGIACESFELFFRPFHYGTGEIRGLKVEDIVNQIVERLMPLLDRSNRMMLRNLKGLKEWHQPPLLSVNAGRAEQVNVGAQQVNVPHKMEGR